MGLVIFLSIELEKPIGSSICFLVQVWCPGTLRSRSSSLSWLLTCNRIRRFSQRRLWVRQEALPSEVLAKEWIQVAAEVRSNDALWTKACKFDPVSLERNDVMSARGLCGSSNTLITRSYGGHYFSPAQALTTDALLATMPMSEPHRSACLATLIWAVARCVAAPGHTAQPFQPTAGALPYLREAWSKDLLEVCTEVLPTICGRVARVQGDAVVADAMEIARHEVTAGDLVFLDPPYSAAQYSRFYHVLETVARGYCGKVSGGGRYPPFAERPRSAFSLLTEANKAMD